MDLKKLGIIAFIILTQNFIFNLSAKVRVNPSVKFQKIEEFGAAVAWYYNLLPNHTKNDSEINKMMYLK